MPTKGAQKKRAPTKTPGMTPLQTAISSRKNSVRVTKTKAGDIKYKVNGPLVWAAVPGAGLLVLSIVVPTIAPWIGSAFGLLVAAAIVWGVSMVFVRGKSIDANYERNQFEGGRRASGAKWFAVKGGSAWVAVGVILVALFLWLNPAARLWFGIPLGVGLVVGAVGIVRFLRSARASRNDDGE